MNSLALRKAVPDCGVAATYRAPFSLARLWPRQKPARLRRKGPVFWVALALVVVAADLLLACFAWLAVDLVLG
jgi:hypothetical protein